MGKDQVEIEQALVRVKEIGRLQPFIAAYEETCSDLDIDELAKLLKKTKAYGAFDYGDDAAVERHMTELFAIQSIFLDTDEADMSGSMEFEAGYPY